MIKDPQYGRILELLASAIRVIAAGAARVLPSGSLLPLTSFLLLLVTARADAQEESPVLAYQAIEVIPGGMLTEPLSLAVAATGPLHVLVPAQSEILVVDPFRGVIRKARMEVPEDIRLGRLGWIGDTLWVAGSGRYLTLTPQLRPTGQIDASLPGRYGDLYATATLAVVSLDRFIVRTAAPVAAIALADPRHREAADRIPPELQPRVPVAALPLWVTDRNGTVKDTLALLDTRTTFGLLFPSQIGEGTRRLAMVPIVEPFADFPVAAADHAGLRVVVVERRVAGPPQAAQYGVTWLNVDGDTLLNGTYQYLPTAMREDWSDAAARIRLEAISSDSTLDLIEVRKALYIPPWLPPVTGVLVGADGAVWIRREEIPESRLQRWDVLRPDGTRVGTVNLPRDLELRAARYLEAWALRLVRDAVEVWYVRVQL